MPKKLVNVNFLQSFFEPLIGGADDEHMVESYRLFDGNDELQVKKMFREIFKPSYDTWNNKSKMIAKNTLEYAIFYEPTQFLERTFDSMLLPMDIPKDIRQWFIWLWEGFFPKEQLEKDDVRNYHIDNNADAPILKRM